MRQIERQNNTMVSNSEQEPKFPNNNDNHNNIIL